MYVHHWMLKKKYNSFYENTEQQNCCLHLKQCLYSFLRSNKHLGCISFPTDCMKLILYIIYWIIYFWQYYCAALVENNNRPYWLILWTLLMYFMFIEKHFSLRHLLVWNLCESQDWHISRRELIRPVLCGVLHISLFMFVLLKMSLLRSLGFCVLIFFALPRLGS